MLEYVFFDAIPYQKFLTFLGHKNIPFEESTTQDILMVSVSEDIDASTSTAIEHFYDDMMELGADILAEQTDDDQVNTAGLTVTLKNGQISYAVVDPSIINKVLDVLSTSELSALINAIANAV
jgi:membrane-bound ClpP family serine protease